MARKKKPARPRQGELIILCPHHNLRLRAGHSRPEVTYYYCPDVDCPYSRKIPRPTPPR